MARLLNLTCSNDAIIPYRPCRTFGCEQGVQIRRPQLDLIAHRLTQSRRSRCLASPAHSLEQIPKQLGRPQLCLHRIAGPESAPPQERKKLSKHSDAILRSPMRTGSLASAALSPPSLAVDTRRRCSGRAQYFGWADATVIGPMLFAAPRQRPRSPTLPSDALAPPKFAPLRRCRAACATPHATPAAICGRG
jgi:hypothetical protein